MVSGMLLGITSTIIHLAEPAVGAMSTLALVSRFWTPPVFGRTPVCVAAQQNREPAEIIFHTTKAKNGFNIKV